MIEKVLLSMLLYLGVLLAQTGRKGGSVGHFRWADSMNGFLSRILSSQGRFPMTDTLSRFLREAKERPPMSVRFSRKLMVEEKVTRDIASHVNIHIKYCIH